MKATRNEPCHCGSGRKYKNCCHSKDTASPSKRVKSTAVPWIFGVLGVLALLALALTVGPFRSSRNTPGAVSQGAAGVPAAQPPGPAPAGKVWSAEHGHWHDTPGSQPLQAVPQPTASQPASAGPAPQPSGPAPAGKVWSEEHGHWHDAPQ